MKRILFTKQYLANLSKTIIKYVHHYRDNTKPHAQKNLTLQLQTQPPLQKPNLISSLTQTPAP